MNRQDLCWVHSSPKTCSLLFLRHRTVDYTDIPLALSLLFVLGCSRYLPPALQICPSFLITNTCVQEFLWGMFVWMVLTLSLMVFRGSKRNHIIRNNVCSFVCSNVWILGVETMLLVSGKSVLRKVGRLDGWKTECRWCERRY